MLFIEYLSSSVEYKACNTSGYYESERILVNMSLEPVKPVYVREKPVRIDFEADQNGYYTLMILNIGFGATTYFVCDIRGNDITTGTVVKQYESPLNYRHLASPLVYYLFRQNKTGHGLTTRELEAVQDGNFMEHLASFIDRTELIGPMGMNILILSTDVHTLSVYEQKHPGDVFNCATFVYEKMVEVDELFLEIKPEPFYTYLQVLFIHNDEVYDSPEKIEYCCEMFEFVGETVAADPIGDTIISSYHTQDENSVTFLVNPNYHGFDLDAITEGLYTIMSVDPTASNRDEGTKTKPVLHYLGINFKAVRVKGFVTMTTLMPGTILREWLQPQPEDQYDHRLYFLLLRQVGEIENEVGTNVDLSVFYGARCVRRLEGRCHFGMAKFIKTFKLTLVGASWSGFRSDEYFNYHAETAEEIYCPIRCGYEFTEAPQSAAQQIFDSLTVDQWAPIVFAVSAIISILLMWLIFSRKKNQGSKSRYTPSQSSSRGSTSMSSRSTSQSNSLDKSRIVLS